MPISEVLKLIPQRPPFLFLDSIESFCPETKSILCHKLMTPEEYFFAGHFPGDPIVPGVILQEACFQAGAALMGKLQDGPAKGLGVVTKVENAKFKGLVRPNDHLTIEVSLIDQISNAFYFKGKISVSGKTVMVVQFTCASI